MSKSAYTWPSPEPIPTGTIVRAIFGRLADRLGVSRLARSYALSREIGRRRAFIQRLREWLIVYVDDEELQSVLREERHELVALIERRRDLWQRK